MNDLIEIGHLTKYDAFRVNRDQVMDLDIWFKIHTNVFNFETVSPKTIQSLKNFYQFCNNCKIPSCTYHLKEADMKIAMFAHFKEYHGSHKHFKSLYIYDFQGQCLSVNSDFLSHSGNINLQKGSKISKMPSD